MSKPIVLDCSITLAWYFADERSALAERALAYVRSNQAGVPPLWGLEVTNGLLRAEKKIRISIEGSLSFLELFAKLPIRSVPVSIGDCFTNIYSLAQYHGLSTYDATYLQLAIREKLKLATLDKALATAAKKHGAHWN